MTTDWQAEERVPIHRMLTPADLLSLTNGLLGVLALMAILEGQTRAAFTFIILAVLFDGLDGAIARLGYGGGRLGDKLDSLADLVSFVVAPALLFWTTYRGSSAALASLLPPAVGPWGGTALLLLVVTGYFVSGLLRLARFDYLRGGERHDYFVGVTTPGAATVVASLTLLHWDAWPALVVVAVAGLLMTSRFRLPKLRGSLAPAGGIVLLMGAALGDAYNGLGPLLLLVFFLSYLVLGPGYVRRHEDADDVQPTF